MDSSLTYDREMYRIYSHLKKLSTSNKLKNEEHRRVMQTMEFVKIMMTSETINHNVLNQMMKIRFTRSDNYV